MTLDVSQFVGVFLEESFEGLDLMEAGLLQFNEDDPEAVNSIFRAAHSIKGGAGTFGFREVSDFTHGAETLLDQIRQGERPMNREISDTLLCAVDCIRDMLRAASDGGEADTARLLETRAAIENLLGTPPAEAAGQDAVQDAEQAAAACGWRIVFKPHADMMKTGNDPLRLIAELERFGPLSVKTRADALPSLSDMEPEACHLHWEIELQATADEAELRAVFDWVEDECELRLESLGASSDAPLPAPAGGRPDTGGTGARPTPAGPRPSPPGRPSQPAAMMRARSAWPWRKWTRW